MYIVLVKNKVNKSKKTEYMRDSQLFAEEMKEVAGCKDTYVLTSADYEDVIVNVEVWESKYVYEQYDGHVFLKYKEKLKSNFISNTIETYTL